VIETEQRVVIAAGIDSVWDYAHNIERWADLMPGLQSCTLIDADNSRWTLKVGVGGLVRTVKVLVHVDEWDGPERALFSYKLEGDPVEGGGVYTASRMGAGETEVALKVQVVGSGAMAPMWEAMGKPLLPKLARGFAEQFKAEIERAADACAPARAAPSSFFARLWSALRNLWRRLLAPRQQRW
jgi:carbon monoxide dehydrogenase subunit G